MGFEEPTPRAAGRRCDAPPFADPRPGDIGSRRGEVLTEHSVDQPACEHRLPFVEVLSRVGINGLIVATVQFPVADGVADESAAQTTAHGSRRPDHHIVVRCGFVDTRRPRRCVGIRADAGEVDRQQRCHASKVMVGK